jgi:hypothetical protein
LCGRGHHRRDDRVDADTPGPALGPHAPPTCRKARPQLRSLPAGRQKLLGLTGSRPIGSGCLAPLEFGKKLRMSDAECGGLAKWKRRRYFRFGVGAKTESLEADIPTLEDYLKTYLQRPNVLEQLKPLEEALKRFIDFFAMVGLAFVKMAELPPSRGYEPLLIQYGLNPILSRGMASIAICHGRRRAAEGRYHRNVFDAIRFLAKRDRRQRAIFLRAQLLVEAWDETSIIETVFDEIGFCGTEFIGLLKAVVEGRDVDYRRVTEIAARVAPHLSVARGPKIRAPSAAHEFFLASLVRIKGKHAYTWSMLEENFIDPVTEATRSEFDEPDFDPRPACRRVKAGRGVKLD